MTENITMIELFSGIGAQERALRQLGLSYEVINTCDCDANAVLSYAAMRCDLEKEMNAFDFPSQDEMIEELQAKNLGYDFQKCKHTITKRTPLIKLKRYYIADKLSKNLGDISKIERLPYVDFWTYSYPCTDLSVAGKGEGMINKCDKCEHTWPIDFKNPKTNNICPDCGNIDIKSTRSGLLGQVQRLLTVSHSENTLPKYLLLENVKNLVGSKFKPQFDAWINWLDIIGYNTYYKVLNSKHYGIPQNRERVFAISIRKDIDTKKFVFPEQIQLKLRLKDILEKNVDEKHYLPDERIEKILKSATMQKKDDEPQIIQKYGDRGTSQYSVRDYAHTIPSNPMSDRGQMVIEPQIIKVGQVSNDGSQSGMVYSTDGLFPAMCAGCHGYAMGNILEPQVLRAERTEYGKSIRKQYEAGEIQEKIGNMRELKPRIDGISNTITTLLKDNYVIEPIIIEDFYKSRNPRLYESTAPTLRSERIGLKVAVENSEYPCSTRGKQVASAIRASIYKQGARNLEENVVNGLGYEGVIEEKETKWKIRKLTTKECSRLMNFTDKDHDSIAQYVSDSAIYKQYGNSIVVACLIAIMSSLFVESGYKAEVWTKYALNYNDNTK